MTSSSSVSFPVLVEVVQKYNTEGLIKFLRNEETLKEIHFNKTFFKRLYDEEIMGHLFLKLTRQEFREFRMKIRPALELEEFVENLSMYNNYEQVFLH
ncbi:hypothetical protein RclHR1_00640026 [Rhizophagus clarus]|uniref:Uncharacterized protein n=1 Tax=Rhizophagus clarus TaxID=94130 RepID=A0A2Z6RRK1_9GLOM|nr:hypothetical protein RclHR1_00640026 [Rhizophagus clarus]